MLCLILDAFKKNLSIVHDVVINIIINENLVINEVTYCCQAHESL